MADLYFRDGSRYEGHAACNYNPAKGQARVLIYKPCGSCAGKSKAAEWFNTGWRCFRCGGSKVERKQTWVQLYTQARLKELNDKEHPPKPPSVVAVAEVKRGFKQFVRDRGNLIALIDEYAPMSERLQEFDQQINEGMALEPSEIREALRCIDKLRK